MALTQQLNAVFRLAVYYSLVMILLTRNVGHLTVALVTAALTAMVHELSTGKAEKFTSSACVMPTKENPFMNMLPSDDPTRSPACDPLSPAVQKQIASAERAPQTDGPYEHGRMNRTWYTMPNTKAVNDQDKLATWLYGGDKTDKTAGKINQKF